MSVVTSQVAEIEQQIRDHCMSPADMLVEVRSLIRKQNTGFEAISAENDRLQCLASQILRPSSRQSFCYPS